MAPRDFGSATGPSWSVLGAGAAAEQQAGSPRLLTFRASVPGASLCHQHPAWPARTDRRKGPRRPRGPKNLAHLSVFPSAPSLRPPPKRSPASVLLAASQSWPGVLGAPTDRTDRGNQESFQGEGSWSPEDFSGSNWEGAVPDRARISCPRPWRGRVTEGRRLGPGSRAALNWPGSSDRPQGDNRQN